MGKNFHSMEIRELRKALIAHSNASFGGKILTSMLSEILAEAPDDFQSCHVSLLSSEEDGYHNSLKKGLKILTEDCLRVKGENQNFLP